MDFDSNVGSNVNLLLITYNLLIAGYAFSRGFRSLDELTILIFTFILSIGILISKKTFIVSRNSRFSATLFLTLAISASLALLLYGGLYQHSVAIRDLSKLLLTSVLFASVIFILSKRVVGDSLRKIIFAYILITVFSLQVLMIVSSPQPYIDAFYISKESIGGLLSGQNPYSMIFTKLYPGVTPDYYTYLPTYIYVTFLPVLLFNDPRVAFIISQVISVYFITKILRGVTPQIRQMALLIFLLNPMTLFVLEQSYGELLMPVFMLGMIYFASTRRNVSSIFLGLFASLKQIHLPVIPMFLMFNGLKGKPLFYSIFIPLLSSLPFLIWSPRDFIRDNFLIYLNSPNPSAKLSLNIPQMVETYLHFRIPLIFTGSILVLFYLFLLKKLEKDNLFQLVYFIYIWFFAVFLLGTQAFVNNYYLASSLLFLSIIVAISGKTSRNL